MFTALPAAAGVTLFTQAVAADASQPAGVALSNGISGTAPFVKGALCIVLVQITRKSAPAVSI
jgi:hypothetical protein